MLYPYICYISAFSTAIEVPAIDSPTTELVIAMTSDKGLCGGVHSSVCKTIRSMMYEKKPEKEVKLLLVGDKANQMLTR